jgi:hypothetical protein
MNNEQKREYIQPEMTVFETVYEKKLLLDASPEGEIVFEDNDDDNDEGDD